MARLCVYGLANRLILNFLQVIVLLAYNLKFIEYNNLKFIWLFRYSYHVLF
ncbi:protein of unknown function [Xenorhabdus poinarii G6]|uniref:Uncharacterized protein n=1 Tax=Xenorhabdus poinarii G6 TaxID=1354304 RepID=A0A068R285_9GAMM|nr:protein of unknown function [Xenorhabdus poinarii G6]